MALVAAGIIVGLSVTLAAASLLDKLLFLVSPRDPAVYAIAMLALTILALLANAIPARRAARLDPMRALRAE